MYCSLRSCRSGLARMMRAPWQRRMSQKSVRWEECGPGVGRLGRELPRPRTDWMSPKARCGLSTRRVEHLYLAAGPPSAGRQMVAEHSRRGLFGSAFSARCPSNPDTHEGVAGTTVRTYGPIRVIPPFRGASSIPAWLCWICNYDAIQHCPLAPAPPPAAVSSPDAKPPSPEDVLLAFRFAASLAS